MTRDQLEEVRDEFLDGDPALQHLRGGRDRLTGAEIPEDYIPNPNGGRSGGSYSDLTFKQPDGTKIRVNTVDTYSNNSQLT